LDLVKDETKNIDSRFLEPACGDGNFLIEVLRRKLEVVKKQYKKSQFEYEKHSLIAVSSIYGIDLLEDNVENARKRLYTFFVEEYIKLYKKKINEVFLKNIQYLLKKNILQGNALDLKTNTGKPIIFAQWGLISGSKIKRKDFQFRDLAEFEEKKEDLFSQNLVSDTGENAFIPEPIQDYSPVSFMNLYQSYE
ncbi:MAG: SAM-dependent DNA methyltransferase, partial [Candidatus Moranbacteria bacterium]|nr:SAM-dependent DNA methyltransferase [Candidatus Moranbacteria bacterium]